ncbi:unnamed protein product [Periconia digitata]|uniref:Uncharacterized protein n=1 Tax=Periconia digitata TaxID=1303443 RepID=A0A9W4U3R3_9PLEO|nr:unnamed protein product [Periconia digitata]
MSSKAVSLVHQQGSRNQKEKCWSVCSVVARRVHMYRVRTRYACRYIDSLVGVCRWHSHLQRNGIPESLSCTHSLAAIIVVVIVVVVLFAPCHSVEVPTTAMHVCDRRCAGPA